MINNNPFNVKLIDVVITKFNNTDRMSIMPQVVEFVLFQSIFSPVLKAQLAILDGINLLNNYPLTGEEKVEITFEQGSDNQYDDISFTTKFVITGVNNIHPSDSGRELAYFIELDSEEAFVNAKTKVSHAYYDSIENIMENILQDYLKTDKQFYKFGNISEQTNEYLITKKTRSLIVPNLRPFAALKWLSGMAVSAEPDKYYSHVFYESLNVGEYKAQVNSKSGFVFKSLQRPSFKGLDNEVAISQCKKEQYFYVDNIDAVLANPERFKALQNQGFDITRSILSLKYNKRYSTLEKIIGGYYENEYVEINMLQKDHKITRSTINDGFNSLQFGKLNTENYINSIINQDERSETSARVKYVINNFDDLNQPSLRDKFGKAARSFFAMSQVDISAGVPTDLTLRPGDVFYANLPEHQGFNDVDIDKYISGYFIISEIKNVIRPSGETATLLRINKDSYLNSLFESSLYNLTNNASIRGGV